MATVGEPLLTPETGWQRIDDRDPNIIYSLGFSQGTNVGDFNSTWTQVLNNTKPETATFNFVGTKIRILGIICTAYPQYAYIRIDGEEEQFVINSGNSNLRSTLLYEKTGLELKEHSVEIIQKDNSYLGLVIDAYDIDDTGILKPYTPPLLSVAAPTNLNATAGDSKVTLSWTAVNDATGYNVKRSTTAGGPYTNIATNVPSTSYVDTLVTNGTTYYYVVTALNGTDESTNSNEVAATPAAVVIPTPEGQAVLRVTMIDSSEREYRLPIAEIDGFVNWYTRTIGTGISCYALNDIVDDSKEYLAFEKIISFKVIPLAK